MATEIALPPGRLPAELMDLHWETVHEGSITIIDLLDNLPWTRGAADWKPWRSFLKAVYGLPMDADELAIFRQCTGRAAPPEEKVDEVWMAVGRRGRKSAIAALIGVFEGAYRDHRPHLAPGEPGVVPIIAKDKEDAQTIKNFVANILADDGMAHLVHGDVLAERIHLTTQVDLMIRAATVTAGRSKAVVASLNDEIAFWPKKDSATPDEEILRGIRPGMANIPGALLVAMSSPYAKKGLLYENFEAHFGREHDPILFWKAPTTAMHDTPAIRAFVRKEWEGDAVAAKAEVGWGSEAMGPPPDAQAEGIHFREDVEIFIDPDKLRALVVEPGRGQLAPCSDKPIRPLRPGQEPDPNDVRFSYFGFFDASGGSSESAALSIAHWDHRIERAVQDFVQEWRAPFHPKEVAKEAALALKVYRLETVRGDQYGGEWVRDRFADFGIGYVEHEMPKRDIYKNLLPRMNSGEVELLDNRRVFEQFKGLERRKTATGLEIIDHPTGSMDDVANATAGALLDASTQGRYLEAPEPEVVCTTTEEILEKELQEMVDEATRVKEDGDQWHDRYQE